VTRRRWLSPREFDDGVALCQALPGATAMQTAAYVGLRLRGVLGAVASFAGFGLPAFVLMLGLTALYSHTQRLPAVLAVFGGLQAVVVAIAANATVFFGRHTLVTGQRVALAVLAAGLFAVGINPFLVILLASVLGLGWLRDATPVEPGGPAAEPLDSTTRPVACILGVAVLVLGLLFVGQRPLFDLAITVLRVDLFAFGGGFASVPLLFHEVVEVRGWLSGPTLLDGVVLGQVTPGPIVITAAFVGFLRLGLLGGVVATVGVFLPSFLMVVGVAPHFDRLRASPRMGRLMAGALCSFPGLLLVVSVRFAQDITWDAPRLVLAFAAFLLLRVGVNILWVVLMGGIGALIFCR
jgi:chromate transporter